MKVVDVIRACKQNVSCGGWEQGPVPRAKFPLTRSKLSLGRGWSWRIVTFSALEQQFYVLVALSQEKESYRAILGMKDGATLKVVCHHELHTDHWNWHCHIVRGNIHETFPGVLRDRINMSVWPVYSQGECTVPFNVTKQSALTVAAERFRFTEGGSLI